MNTNTLINALTAYLKECPSEEFDEVLKGLMEATEVKTKQRIEDCFNDDVHFVDRMALGGMLNEMLYDNYGKLFKSNKGRPCFGSFCYTCCKYHDGISLLPADVLQMAYDIIGDLYADNDCEIGTHNPDGTFNKLNYKPAYISAAELGLIEDAMEFVTTLVDMCPNVDHHIFSSDADDAVEDQKFYAGVLKDVRKTLDEADACGYDSELIRK